MAPNLHVKKAFAAMTALGIERELVKPVLKTLLDLYDKNWDLIAEENYRVLADAIFDAQDSQTKAGNDTKRKHMMDEEGEPSGAGVNKEKKKVPEDDEDEEDEDVIADLGPPLKRLHRSGGGSALSLRKSTSPSLGSPSFKDDEETATILLPDSVEREHSVVPMPDMDQQNGHGEERNGETSGTVSVNCTANDILPSETKMAANLEDSSALELASSDSGEVKINLSFAPATGGSTQHLPSMAELRRAMEEKCLRSYKILDPNFSVLGFMNDICNCYLDLATKATNSASQQPESLPSVTINLDGQMPSVENNTVEGSNGQIPSAENNTVEVSNDHMPSVENTPVVDDSMGLVVVPECQVFANDWRSISSIADITLGREAVEIPWVNEVNDKVPPPFRYIAQSIVYVDASVKFSLGTITDEQCCSSCFGDCLATSLPCNCVSAVDGFAYTRDGVLQQSFLEECIAEARDPEKKVVQNCNVCPLEKVRNKEILEPCRGHVLRKFIKECWSKCGCVTKCGNRVIQQGIQNKLQVFYTPNGSGWGLRTLEKLPKGAFVCEFAGEIMTISELDQRDTERLTHPVMLDANWGSGELEDDKALCLDGTHYGNVSRFINHRCLDANLIGIPVHVESFDKHYYHVAFFTTREIDSMEELTRDYGMEFNNHVFPTIPFHCQCGSKFCRNIQRRSKGKSAKKRA